jgi:hypothetical protein
LYDVVSQGYVTSDIEINEKYGTRIVSDRGIPKYSAIILK